MTGVAVQGNNPNFIARVGRHGWNGTGCAGDSADGGRSYSEFTTYPCGAAGGRIAVAANTETMLWATQGGFTYRSTDRGASWAQSTGVPSGVVPGTTVFDGGIPNPLAADKVNGNKFYIYYNSSMYVSTDAGVSFTAAATLPYITSISFVKVETSPGIEGDLWVSFGAWSESGFSSGTGLGLYHSTDSGVSFTKISNVQDARQMSVGKAATTIPAVYVQGTVNNITNGAFRSDDNGATWTQINDPAVNPGNYREMAADQNVYGRVFLAAAGNGIFVGTPVGIPSAPTGLTATAGNAQVALSWNASTSATSYNVKRSTVSGTGYVTVSSPTTTSYTDAGVTNGTTYYYVVTAVNGFGESANSAQASATPNPPPPPPAAPTGLAATAGDAPGALRWTASTGATSDKVLRSTVSGGPHTTVVTGVTATSYTNTGPSNPTTSHFPATATHPRPHS